MTETPASLVAILVAAHRTNDRDLEREARRELEDRFALRVRFLRDADAKERRVGNE